MLEVLLKKHHCLFQAIKRMKILVQSIKTEMFPIKITLSKFILQAAIKFLISIFPTCQTESMKYVKIYRYWNWNTLFRIRSMKVNLFKKFSEKLLLTYI